MNIRIRLFAHMAAIARTPELTISVPDGSRLSAIKPILQHGFPKVPWPPGTLLAVNQEYTPQDHLLQDHDEVAIIPPVSGGKENLP